MGLSKKTRRKRELEKIANLRYYVPAAGIETTLGLRNNIGQFSTLDGANRWANNCIKLHIVMLGDNGKYWVACFADAQKLSKMGYEIAA